MLKRANLFDVQRERNKKKNETEEGESVKRKGENKKINENFWGKIEREGFSHWSYWIRILKKVLLSISIPPLTSPCFAPHSSSSPFFHPLFASFPPLCVLSNVPSSLNSIPYTSSPTPLLIWKARKEIDTFHSKKTKIFQKGRRAKSEAAADQLNTFLSVQIFYLAMKEELKGEANEADGCCCIFFICCWPAYNSPPSSFQVLKMLLPLLPPPPSSCHQPLLPQFRFKFLTIKEPLWNLGCLCQPN